MSRVTGNPARRVDVLRRRGVRGGRIAPHRAMIGLEVSRWLLVDLIALPIMFALGVFVTLEYIMQAWYWFFEQMRAPLGFPGIGTRIVEIVPNLAVAVPYYTAEASWPSSVQLGVGWVVTAVLAIVGALLRGRFTPLGYLLRGVAIVQLSAQVWFTLAEPPFAYALPQYMSAILLLGVVILLLSPFLVALTFFIFDFTLLQKATLAVLLVLHLSVLVPLQAAVHAFIVYKASLLAMPVLFLVFGLLLDVFVYVALYGWGMSWRSGGPLDWSDRRMPPATETPAQGVAIT